MPIIVYRTAAFLCARFCRNSPSARLTLTLWTWVIRPRIVWRSLTLKTKTKFGARFEVRFPDLVQSYIYFFGVWEPAITHYIEGRLKPGDTFIDVGANIGYYSILASRLVGRTGRVFAIEAIPAVFDALNKHIRENRVQNVAAYNVAVTGEPRSVTMFFDPLSPGTSTANRHSNGKRVVVQGKPLHLIVEPEIVRGAKIIKIDVEGAEWDTIRGFRNELKHLSPSTEILIETNKSAIVASGGSLDEFLGFFTDAGFKPFLIRNRYNPAFYAERLAPMTIEPLGDKRLEEMDLLFKKW